MVLTKDTIYIAFDCVDPEPSRLSIHSMQRDGEIGDDDYAGFVLDTFGDRRTGYLFATNPAGARLDGLVSGPEDDSFDWDGIWDVKTARTSTGWTAEFAIPTRTLGFGRNLKTFGINFERNVARERIKLRWKGIQLDAFITDLSRAGELPGVEILEQGRGLEFSPFAVGRVKDEFQNDGRVWQGQVGGDVTWRLTPQLAAVFTANTDFAETEVDSRQLNVTRFPLFFPERRAFFLEGSNQLEFGLSLEGRFMPFFSRRIGLLEGQQIPINGGVKLNGRIGKLNVGILDVQTRESRWAPSVNLFAGRISYDFTKEFRLGGILTNGDPTGRGRNTLGGVDGVWRTSKFRTNKNFLIGGYAAATGRDNLSGDKKAAGYKIDYPNDRLDCFQQFDHFGDALNPELGFLPRPGTNQLQFGCRFSPRPARDGKWSWIRQYNVRNYYQRVDNIRGFNETWRYTFSPLGIEFDSGDEIEFTVLPQHEYLTVPFEIAPGVVIPVGDYHFTRADFEASTSRYRSWRVSNDTNWGAFYNGTLLQQENEIDWTSPKGRLRAGIGWEQNFGRLKQGSFVQRLYQINLALMFSPNLALTSFLQYDNESSNFGQNTRFRWTFKPGNDLFLVWNRGWKRLILSPYEKSLIPDSELIAVKLRWTFRP